MLKVVLKVVVLLQCFYFLIFSMFQEENIPLLLSWMAIVQVIFKNKLTIWSCRRLPPVTAYSTPLTIMDKTRARRDMLCPYLKIKLTELLVNNSLDKYFPPPFWSYIFICLYTNIYTYMILRIFKCLCAKSIQISKKIVSWRKGHRQMFIVLNLSGVLTQIWLVKDKYSYQTRTNQKRCWNMVKIGHQDLILTTLLKASGRL